MSDRGPRLKAKQFLYEYGLRDVTYSALKQTAEKQGYTVVEFNHISNGENVAALINALKLGAHAATSKGFTYADRNHRVVFVHDGLSDAEKAIVLAHEIGHIYCGHMSTSPIIGLDVREEHEANEFAHYLLHPSLIERVEHKANRNKKLIAVICAALCVCLVAGIVVWRVAASHKDYYGDYYLSETGHSYHLRDCGYIKDKSSVHRMTVEEFESGRYTPCAVCIPDDTN